MADTATADRAAAARAQRSRNALQRRLDAAADLLREAGWTVEPPKA